MAEISSVIQHASLTGDNIHVPYAGTYATEAARLAAALDQSMEGKLFRQLSDNTLWMLVSAANKTWIPLGKATAKYLGKDGNDNSPMTFNWSGQGGQPEWLWGGNDGANMYVYNPANFSVNYATSANYANSAGSANAANAVTGNIGNVHAQGRLSRTGAMGTQGTIYAPSGGQWLLPGDQTIFNNNETSAVTIRAGVYTGGAAIGTLNLALGEGERPVGHFLKVS